MGAPKLDYHVVSRTKSAIKITLRDRVAVLVIRYQNRT